MKINLCALRELMRLPGIGRQLCDSFMDLREAKCNITLNDLVCVKYLQSTEQLVSKLDFAPYQVGQSSDTSTEDVYARIGQAIYNSRLRVPHQTTWLHSPRIGSHPACKGVRLI